MLQEEHADISERTSGIREKQKRSKAE